LFPIRYPVGSYVGQIKQWPNEIGTTIQTIIYKRQKTKYWATQTQLKSGVESGASEGYVVLAPPIQIISRLTLVSDPISRRFIRWLLFQTFFSYWHLYIYKHLSRWQPDNISVPLDLKVTYDTIYKRQKTKYWATQTQLKSGVESGASEGYVVLAPPIQIISRNEEHRICIRIAQIIGTLLWFSSLNYRITKLSENENSVLVWNIQWVHTLNVFVFALYID
jgi:hypothetical protein